MYRTHQRLSCEFGSASYEKCLNGCSGSRHYSKVWHASFKVMGSEIEGDTTAGFLLCNNPGVWTNEEVITGTKNEIYDHKQGETYKSSN